MSGALQTLADGQGTIVAGLLSANVYYIRISDHLSPFLAQRFSALLRQELSTGARIAIFLDVESTSGSDFSARSSIMQALLSQRKRIHSGTILVTPGPRAARLRAMASMLGNRFQLVDSLAVFQARLREAAPSARNFVPASGSMPVARSIRQGAKSTRPGARSVRPRGRIATRG